MIIKYIWKKDTNRLKPLFSKQKYFRSEKYIISKSQKWNRYNDNTMEAVLIKYSNKLKAFSLLRYQRDGEKFGWVKLSAFGAYFLKAKSWIHEANFRNESQGENLSRHQIFMGLHIHISWQSRLSWRQAGEFPRLSLVERRRQWRLNCETLQLSSWTLWFVNLAVGRV